MHTLDLLCCSLELAQDWTQDDGDDCFLYSHVFGLNASIYIIVQKPERQSSKTCVVKHTTVKYHDFVGHFLNDSVYINMFTFGERKL